MNSIFRSPTALLALILFILPLLTACVPDTSAAIISPNLGSAEATATASPAYAMVDAEPTAAPPTLADLSVEEQMAGLPADVAAAMADADPADGPTLATLHACVGCHLVDPDGEGSGPTWHDLGNRAVERSLALGKEGPAAYLYESIAAPGAYVVNGYDDGLMPQDYSEKLSTEEFATLVAYILTLQEE